LRNVGLSYNLNLPKGYGYGGVLNFSEAIVIPREHSDRGMMNKNYRCIPSRAMGAGVRKTRNLFQLLSFENQYWGITLFLPAVVRHF